MNSIAIWSRLFDDYFEWCYKYRIPDIKELINGFEYELCDAGTKKEDPYIKEKYTYYWSHWRQCIIGDGLHRMENIKISLNNGLIRVVKNKTLVDMIVDYDDSTLKEGIYGIKYMYYKYLKPLHEIHYEVTKEDKQKYMNKEEKIPNNTKSKYKLNSKLVKPNLKILSVLIKKSKSLDHYISKLITVPERWLGIKLGYKPLHTIEEIKNNLYNKQPEKSPERLVYIATKDRQQISRLKWKDANEKIITQLADELQWEYISKQEGKKLMKPNPGLSFIPAQGDIKYKDKVKHPRTKSSTKKDNNLSKRKHPSRVNKHKIISKYDVTLIKYNPDSPGDIKETDYSFNTTSEQKAINKSWKELVPIKVGLSQIKPYYKAVVKRSDISNTNDQPKKDLSTRSFLEPKKHVLITTLKNGEKKTSEITTYKRVYSKLRPPWKIKKWKCPMTNPSKKFSAMKIEIERKKLQEELKLKKQNKVIERKTINKNILV
jgi:hypothetical protein